MLASLRKREEEVKQQMAGHLRDRDKERENHQHLEAGNQSRKRKSRYTARNRFQEPSLELSSPAT